MVRLYIKTVFGDFTFKYGDKYYEDIGVDVNCYPGIKTNKLGKIIESDFCTGNEELDVILVQNDSSTTADYVIV